jgi:hypothetical protein
MNYKNKYIKYKYKYISLQNGGVNDKINLVFSSFSESKETNIGYDEFYKFYDISGNQKFAIVNGNNTKTEDKGGGTVGALKLMNDFYEDELFYKQTHDSIYDKKGDKLKEDIIVDGITTNKLMTNSKINNKGIIIFNSNTISQHLSNNAKLLISREDQMTKVNSDLKLKLNAGSVLKIKSIKPENKIQTVYHLKGVSLQDHKDKSHETDLQKLVYTYYTNILEDFEKETDAFIYIPQIPGVLFNGGELTRKMLSHSVYNFIHRTGKPERSFTIILGISKEEYDEDTKSVVQHSDYLLIPPGHTPTLVLNADPIIKKNQCKKK